MSNPLVLTMGDPAGIGPDITLKAWAARRQHGVPPFALFADPDVIRARAAQLQIAAPVGELTSLSNTAATFPDALPIFPVAVRNPVKTGQPDPGNGAATIGSIDAAVEAVHRGLARAIVTNPIAKSVLYDAGFKHPGHTEYLATLAAQHWGGEPPRAVMLLTSDELKVAPATIHIPLADVPGALNAAVIEETALIMLSALAKDYGIAGPRLAVTGLNPHAGEAGALGAEDSAIIEPVITRLAAEGHNVTGPYPADTIFHADARKTYDAVLAMYHDQALIPIKTLAFDRGVNVTCGLPFVRTSPDHGTAFAIAGTGAASATSLIHALKEAEKISVNRSAIQPEPAPA